MLHHYLSAALRNFKRHAVTTSINIVGLALGLACFIAAQSAVTYLRSGDRHFANADRIYAIAQRHASSPGNLDPGLKTSIVPLIAGYLRADFPELEAVARVARMASIAAATEGDAAFVSAAAAEPDFLRMFDFEFIAGGGQDALRLPRAAVLTRTAAIRLFGTPEAAGRNLLLSNAVNVTVTGVIEEVQQPSHIGSSAISAIDFEILLSWDVYRELSKRPWSGDPDAIPEIDAWGWNVHRTYVMLPRDGSFSASQLNERLPSFVARHVPPERAVQRYEFLAISLPQLWMTSIDAGWLGGGGVSAVSLMTLLSGLILLTACVNYANLATAQAATRLREIGLRRIVGAKSASLAAQFLIESALITSVSLFIALSFIAALAPVVRSGLGVDLIEPLRGDLQLWAWVATALAVIVLAGGSYPVMAVSRLRPVQSLRGGPLTQMPAFVPKLLVGIQFGATSLLLTGVIVVYAQQREMRERALGESGDVVVAIRNDLRASNVAFETLRQELLLSPHVRSVASMDTRPWAGVNSFAVARTQDPAENVVPTLLYAVAGDFFATVDLRLLAGRAFDARIGADAFPGTIPAVMDALGAGKTYNVVIDSRLAAQLGWPDPQDAVGQLIYMPFSRSRIGRSDQTLRVAGVVEYRPLSLVSSTANANLFYFLPDPAGFEEVLVRLAPDDMGGALAALDAVWGKLSRNIPLTRQFVDEVFESSYAPFNRINSMIAGMAMLAVVISGLGLFGMALFIATRRRHEIGVRKTLGATTGRVTALLVYDFSKPVLIANIVAWPFAYFAARSYLSSFVHRIDLTPLPFIASGVLALLVAWIAVGGQTLRAARTRPSEVLRYE